MKEITDLAYAAGYTDGDGCFHIIKFHAEDRTRHRATFIINSTEIDNVQWFQKVFGGSITSSRRQKSNHKIIYRYVLKGKFLEEFKEILPFLREKSQECIIFYEFIKGQLDRDSLIEDMKHYKESAFLVHEMGKEFLRSFKAQIIPCVTDFAYLAGFIDAECCLNIQKSFPKNRPNPTYKIQLQCNNTKWPTLLWIAQRFGGQFHYIDRTKYKNNRDQVTWRLSAKALYPVLIGIYPFLKHKKPVCEKMIEFYGMTLDRSKSPSANSPQFTEFYRPFLEAKECIFHQIQSLNKKGV